MQNSQQRQRNFVAIIMTVAVIISSCIMIILLRNRAGDKEALQSLRDVNSQLRTQLEARDRTISDLHAKVQQLEATVAAISKRQTEIKPPPASVAESELSRRLGELLATQTKTLTLVEKVAATTGASETPERRQAALALLRETAAEEEQKLATARKRTADLRETLKVPDEVAALPTEKVASTPNFSLYRPFFEAKRDEQIHEVILARIQMKLALEETDLRI